MNPPSPPSSLTALVESPGVDRASRRDILMLFASTRIFILAVGYACFYSYYPGEPPAPPGYDSTQGALTWNPLTLLNFYDVSNYLSIAAEGYSPRQTPFFPLYPLFLSLFGGRLWTGIVLSNLFFLASLAVLNRLWGRSAVLAAVLSPIGIYFMTVYTESLYLLVSSLTLLAVRERRWMKGGLFAGLAALTRPVGWSVLPPFALYAFSHGMRRWKPILLALGLTMLYPLYLGLRFGHPLLFLEHESSRFTRQLVIPGWGLVSDLRHVIRGEVPAEWTMMFIFNAVGVLLLGLGLRRFTGILETERFWLYTLCYLLFILATPITDFAYLPATHAALRYAFACAPIYALVGSRKPLLVAMLPLQVMVTLMVAVKWFIA